MNRILSVILLLALVSSCTSQLDEQLAYALELSKDNRPELEKVIGHYTGCPQKQEAARWLIANMPGHSTMWSESVQAFADSVMRQRLPQERGNQLWDSLQKISAPPHRQRDIETLSAEFLIDNIDRAFDVWNGSPWRDEVDFDLFKKFVLPYRADNELLRIGWRDSLIKTYAPVVEGAKTAKEAYERLRKAVNSVKRNGKYDFPYVMDAVALRNHYSGVCLERCVYFTTVCRAFGLPAVIDNCGKWANYSNNTHTWVALILKDGTYTIIDEDSIAKKDNIIDASTFALKQTMPEWYPYTAEFRKRLVKVWRQTYDINPVASSSLFDGQSGRLSSPRLMDVSADYG
ncbi:MAG: transglutaminase-like domain-containing protein, partial [Duncaniella sp.]|nr:transglutaminase-like domain-containing protein [Duncaniella sp.]